MKFAAAVLLACLLGLTAAQQVVQNLGNGLHLVRQRGSRELGIDHTGQIRVFTNPGSLELVQTHRGFGGRRQQNFGGQQNLGGQQNFGGQQNLGRQQNFGGQRQGRSNSGGILSLLGL